MTDNERSRIVGKVVVLCTRLSHGKSVKSKASSSPLGRPIVAQCFSAGEETKRKRKPSRDATELEM
jgi:hypothetical protein